MGEGKGQHYPTNSIQELEKVTEYVKCDLTIESIVSLDIMPKHH